jgi:HEAT repeat protein
LDEWLSRLGGPGFRSLDDRDRAVEKMRAAGTDVIFPLLIPMLIDVDPERRSNACEAVLLVDAQRGVPLVLPLLRDPDEGVRWWACDCLRQHGDERAAAPLIGVLQSDDDAEVRGAAARALGRLGGPAVIPALLAALAADHEEDIHGHSPAWSAALALDEILGTEETRVRISDLNPSPHNQPVLDQLRRLAERRYWQWSGGLA